MAVASSVSAKGKRRRVLRIVVLSLAALIVIDAIGALGAAWWIRHDMYATLPQIQGSIHVPGLKAPVTVRRDQHGIPHIQASNMDDLLFAQGYVTAQDRLWEMDVARRFAEGDVAQIFGTAAVPHDKLQRLLLMLQTAQRIAATMSPREQRYFADYARGVNAYIQSHKDNLPTPFRVLMYKPQPWTTVDSVAIGLSMVQRLDTFWPDKLARGEVTAKIGPELAAYLYPTGSKWDHPPIQKMPQGVMPEGGKAGAAKRGKLQTVAQVTPAVLGGEFRDMQRLRAIDGRPVCRGCIPGSNEWVVSGAHTASGMPMLSNDMHLDHQIPDIWYEADLEAGGFHAAGVTIPGVPFIVAGHNDHVAWGFTALYGDTQDLYVEHLNGKGEYQTASGWKPLKELHEVIPVRGGKGVRLTVKITDHGPILNPILRHMHQTLALQWNAYDASADRLPLYALDSASDWKSFLAVLRHWWAPTLNVVYADDKGNIGYHAAGYIPYRPHGLMGVPITNASEHEWQGFIPFDKLPWAYNPPDGVLATANSRVTPDGDPWPITLEWAAPYRNQRIWKTLSGRTGLTPAEMLALQTSVYSGVDKEIAQRLAYAIDHADHAGKRLRQAAELLHAWNGELGINSAAASIVVQAKAAFWPMVLKPKLGKEWRMYSWAESAYVQEEMIMNEPAEWLPRKYANWNDFLAAVVRRGLKDGHAPEDLAKWRYGSWHVLQVEHPLWGLLPWFKSWTGVGPLPQSGDKTTVKQVGRSFGPSQRFTIDWAHPDRATENIFMGESGNPVSPWYRDQFPYWYQGKTFVLPYGNTEVARNTTHTLRLVP